MENHKCTENLRFRGHISDPGFGSAYECAICGKAYWSPNGKSFTPFNKMSPKDCIMDESWVI